MLFMKKSNVSTMSRGYTAFTLAEVLITLGIIGIVAAMTIPTLQNNSQKTQYVTGLKKAYSNTQQAFKMIMADEGVNDFGYISLFDGTSFDNPERNNKIDELIKKFFNVIKSCKYGDASCQIHGYKYLDGTNNGDSLSIGFIFYTADGMAFSLYLYDSCVTSPHYPEYVQIKGICGDLAVDINGIKKPNQWGRDIFSFYIGSNGSLMPRYGVDDAKFNYGANWATQMGMMTYWQLDPYWCGILGSSDVTGALGWGCAARIMEDGWQMNY